MREIPIEVIYRYLQERIEPIKSNSIKIPGTATVIGAKSASYTFFSVIFLLFKYFSCY